MADFTLRIPRTSVAVSEATLVQFLVDDGDFVGEGEPIYVIETEKVETEVDAGSSGRVHWTANLGEVYDIGAEIGSISDA